LGEEVDDGLWAYVLDEARWDAAARYWRRVVDDLAREAGQEGEWASWEPTTYGDGVTPIERRYQPVCEGRSYSLDRAFQIHQRRSLNEEADLAAWVKDYEHDEMWIENEWPRFPRASLVISLSFSNETAETATTLLRRWIQPDTTPESIQATIEQIA
jgi:hypothetical protein